MANEQKPPKGTVPKVPEVQVQKPVRPQTVLLRESEAFRTKYKSTIENKK